MCGDEPACSGKAPYCARGRCVECIGDADCIETKGPGGLCFEGACVECDPADAWACSGKHQACSEDRECVPCSEEQACPGSLFCEFETGLCKPCVEDSQCTDPTKPICAEYTEELSECRYCATDDECAARDPELGQCLSGLLGCAACDPADDSGCVAGEKCFSLDNGFDQYECRPCVSDGECDEWALPFCDLGTDLCVACNDPSIVDPKARCENEGYFACVTTGTYEGQCADCDPGTNSGCYPPAPVCDDDLQCKECVEPDDCPEGFECTPQNECVGCTSDADCADNPHGGQCIDVVGGKACRFCDPVDEAGCPPGETCWQGLSCDSL